MSLLIYCIAFLEGFTTLAIEIIALRRFTPLIDSNSISTSIILGVILLALSYGYYEWGKYSGILSHEARIERVIRNLTLASGYYLFFTFTLDLTILGSMLESTGNYFISVLLSACILFFIPVFLASQTLPLLSELLEGKNIGEKMWKILFFSTVGSFLGSVMTSSLFFATIGVMKSATLCSTLLTGITLLLMPRIYKKMGYIHFFSLGLFILSIFLLFRTSALPSNILFQRANAHHSIMIYEQWERRIFSMNGWLSSGMNRTTKESYFRYIEELKRIILEKWWNDILIIGAAGFTLPQELARDNAVRSIDVVDIDRSLQKIAEEYFLEEKLSEKIHFFPLPARYFLKHTSKHYDAIIVDIYIGKMVPPATMTLEFFLGLTTHTENILMNTIADASLSSQFSEHALATMYSAFGSLFYKDMNAPHTSDNTMTNFVISNTSLTWYTEYVRDRDHTVYTDDKNSIELDLFLLQNERLREKYQVVQ